MSKVGREKSWDSDIEQAEIINRSQLEQNSYFSKCKLHFASDDWPFVVFSEIFSLI